jgi:uncharacterized protein YkwD
MIAAAAVPVTIPAPSVEPVGQTTINATQTQQSQTQHQQQQLLQAQTQEISAQVMALVNQQRTESGCQPLRPDAKIAAAAYEHSRDMGVNGYFDHNSRDNVTPWTRMRAAGYDYPAAENIASGYATAQDVVDGWMSDAAHRANILDCSFRATGVGYYSSPGADTGKPGPGPWWTEDFGYQ